MTWHILTIICGVLTILAALFPESYADLMGGNFMSLVIFLSGAVIVFASLALGSYRDLRGD
jgi:hypothetical protein